MSSATADREAIVALVGAYAERLDAGDLDGVARLFEHGTFRNERGDTLRGFEEVRHMYDPVVLYDDGTPRTTHVLGNIEIAVDGAVATSRCTFTVLQAAPGGPLQPVLAGRYHDRFTCDGGSWQFAERVVHPDLIGALAHHMAAPRQPGS